MTCGDEAFRWDIVVPRIVHPVKVTIIELLRRERRPLSAKHMERLIADPEYSHGKLNYHAETLHQAGVLRLVGNIPRGAANEKFYCLAQSLVQ